MNLTMNAMTRAGVALAMVLAGVGAGQERAAAEPMPGEVSVRTSVATSVQASATVRPADREAWPDLARPVDAFGCAGTAVVPFVPGDATAVLQAAFDGNACTVVIPNVGQPWVTGPLFVRRGGFSIVLEPGAELVAGLGLFPDSNDALIRLQEVSGVTIRGGAGSTIRMLSGIDPDYAAGEWRHAIALVRVDRVRIQGLTIERSGGDGVYVGGNWLADSRHVPSTRVRIEGCVFNDNRRQGISVISVEGLRIVGCEFRDTGATNGTDPMAGIDFEPDFPVHRLIDCRVEDSVFINNRGSNYSSGLHIYTGNFDATSAAVDITVERCTIRSEVTDGAAILMVGAGDDGPLTSLVLRDVTVETSRGVGLSLRTSAANTTVVAERLRLLNTHRDAPAWLGAPIYLDGQSGDIAEYGGIAFIDSVVVDDRARPFIKAFEDRDHLDMPPARCRGLSGTITVINPNPEGRSIDLGLSNDVEITLVVAGE